MQATHSARRLRQNVLNLRDSADPLTEPEFRRVEVPEKSGRAMARSGLRMMPTFPWPSLKFRTAGFSPVRLQGRLIRQGLPVRRSPRRSVRFRPGPSTLNRPHPPHSRAHPDFTALRLILDAFAVHSTPRRPSSGSTLSLPVLLDMPSSTTPGRSQSVCSRHAVPT
jgi:hypothetical protein